MTKQQVRYRLFFLSVVFATIIGASLIEQIFFGRSDTFVSKHGTIIAIGLAGYMAYILQRRGKFVDDLRTWWLDITKSKSKVLALCDKKDITENDYSEAFYALSNSMDGLRVIFCNVDRKRTSSDVGKYPFEQVRDMVDLSRLLDPTRQDIKEVLPKKHIKGAIIATFRSLRHSIQQEATIVAPDHPCVYGSEEREKYVFEILKEWQIDIGKFRKANEALERQRSETPAATLSTR